MKDCCSKGELNQDILYKMQKYCHLHNQKIYVRGSKSKQIVLWNKSSDFTNSFLTQIEMIDIGH